ncbi:lysozyme inhibitor LprI family protein [Burkholderia multivorans]|uniref:lysozyme inhibitor LprI family protein n=1 Tax=Burkholderia multivorans TaxID=87883 RepID=UPI000B08062F|nr:hypothetical protein [Burkholderia multivorans]
MAALGVGLILVGAVVAMAGIGGFIDTRKVDRRFKTGYKNNEPDTRDFGRAGRLLLYGVGTCVIGAAINSFTETHDAVSSVAVTSGHGAAVGQSTQAPANGAAESTDDVTSVKRSVAQAAESDAAIAAVDESSQSSASIPSAHGSQWQPSKNSDSDNNSTSATVHSQTFLTSFDCARARAEDEIAICGDAGLAAMDRQLGELYTAAMRTVSEPRALRRSQSDWVITRHMCNSDIDCLRRAYGERIGQFMGSLGSKPLISPGSQTDDG